MPIVRGKIEPKKIVFICNTGGGYGCNPKYIAEEILRRNRDYDLVWLANRQKESIPKRIRVVQYGSFEAMRELATARIWIDNCRTRRYVNKRPGQYYIQTWHASLSPKKVEADALQSLSPIYIAGAKHDAKETDLMFADNDLFEHLYRERFWYTGEVIRCGVPRNAQLIRPRPESIDRVREELGVPKGKSLCLYAPTFRLAGDLDIYRFDYRRCIEALEERFGKEFVFAVRLHPNIASQGTYLCDNTVLDASRYSDSQELLSATDVLITDYSSIAEDFCITGRPGYLYAPDIEEYTRERGFYYDLECRPYPLSTNEDELIQSILLTPEDVFQAKRNAFFSKMGFDDDGSGAQTLADIIDSVIANTKFVGPTTKEKD